MDASEKYEIKATIQKLTNLYSSFIHTLSGLKTIADNSDLSNISDIIDYAQGSIEDLQGLLQDLDADEDWSDVLDECKMQIGVFEDLLSEFDKLFEKYQGRLRRKAKQRSRRQKS
jgi:hypothetical protein